MGKSSPGREHSQYKGPGACLGTARSPVLLEQCERGMEAGAAAGVVRGGDQMLNSLAGPGGPQEDSDSSQRRNDIWPNFYLLPSLS